MEFQRFEFRVALSDLSDFSLSFLLHFLDSLIFIKVLNFRFDKLSGVSQESGLAYIKVCCVHITVHDIFFDGPVEENRLLHNVANVLPQLLNVVILD